MPIPMPVLGWNWQVRYLDMTFHGNAALATFYLPGSVIWPGGSPDAPQQQQREIF